MTTPKAPITVTNGGEYSGEFYFWDADENLIEDIEVMRSIVAAFNKAEGNPP